MNETEPAAPANDAGQQEVDVGGLFHLEETAILKNGGIDADSGAVVLLDFISDLLKTRGVQREDSTANPASAAPRT